MKNQKRAKRYVCTFFMHMEVIKPDYFWAYPTAFQKWNVAPILADMFDEVYSMYAIE